VPHVIEIDLNETDLNEDQLLEALKAHRGTLEGLTDGDHLEFRANVEDDSFALEEVERVPPPSVPFNAENFLLVPGELAAHPTDQFVLRYTFDWTAYRGCVDADDADTTQSSAQFTYRNGVVRFEFEDYVESDGE
jgi:hypothetical protein